MLRNEVGLVALALVAGVSCAASAWPETSGQNSRAGRESPEGFKIQSNSGWLGFLLKASVTAA
jgi:hypothetical protein